MKKIIFTNLLYLYCTCIVFAQTEKGKFLLGGNLSGAYHQQKFTDQTTKYTNFAMNPKLGYFLVKNLAVGLDLQWSISNQTVKYIDTIAGGGYSTKFRSFSLDPFVRFYWLRKGKIGLFAEGALGYTHNSVIFGGLFAGASDPTKQAMMNYKLGLGGNYFITEKAAFELNIYYQHFKRNNLAFTFPTYTNNLNCSVGFLFFL